MNAPKYQVMRDLTQGEYDELKQSIIENGVLVPVITDERGHIIDGHHRKKICDELGITNYPRSIKMRLTEEDKIAMARNLNEHRRQLTPEEINQKIEQRSEEVRRLLKENPEISDRQIAKQVGVSNSTVSLMRKEMVKSGDVCESHTSIDTLGREQPRQRKDLEGRGQIDHVDKVIDTLGREQPRQRQEMEQSGQLITVISSIGADGKERPRQVERKSGDVITVITSTDPDGIGEYLDAIQTDIEDEDVEDDDFGDMEEQTDEDPDEPEVPRARVISLAGRQQQKEDEEQNKYEGGDNALAMLNKAIKQVRKLNFTDNDIDNLIYYHSDPVFKAMELLEFTLKDISEAAKILNNIHAKLIQKKGTYNAKKY